MLRWLLLSVGVVVVQCEPLLTEQLNFLLNSRRINHVLDEHFISWSVNPSELLTGQPFRFSQNATTEMLKSLSPGYVRLGGPQTDKYVFQPKHKSSTEIQDVGKIPIPEDYWKELNEYLKNVGLDVIMCLSNDRPENVDKWNPRNIMELLEFSDEHHYNLTFQLGYEPSRQEGISGLQMGKDMAELRAILNAFPMYEDALVVGPDIRTLHRKEDVEYTLDVLIEAGPAINAVTWHPRWPHASAITASDTSEGGFDFPADYLEWDSRRLHKLLQRTLLKKPFWISEPMTENIGSYAEGLIYARRLILAAKMGIEVVMKQPMLKDVTHPTPEFWIAFLHKKTMGRVVLDTKGLGNHSEVQMVVQCTGPAYPRSQEGGVTIMAVNMGAESKRIVLRGLPPGRFGQMVHQYILTSGQDDTGIFSQTTYLNGDALLMTEKGRLPALTPTFKRLGQSLLAKLPPYAIGYWVIPHAKVQVCMPDALASFVSNIEQMEDNVVRTTKNAINDMGHLITKSLLMPSKDQAQDLSESYEDNRHVERNRSSRDVDLDGIGDEMKDTLTEIKDMLQLNIFGKKRKGTTESEERQLKAAEGKMDEIVQDLSAVVNTANQDQEFSNFLQASGLSNSLYKIMKGENEERFSGEESGNYQVRKKRELTRDDLKHHPFVTSGRLTLPEIEKRYHRILAKHAKSMNFHPKNIVSLNVKKISKEMQEELILKEINWLQKAEGALEEISKAHQAHHEALEERLMDDMEELKEEKIATLMNLKTNKNLINEYNGILSNKLERNGAPKKREALTAAADSESLSTIPEATTTTTELPFTAIKKFLLRKREEYSKKQSLQEKLVQLRNRLKMEINKLKENHSNAEKTAPEKEKKHLEPHELKEKALSILHSVMKNPPHQENTSHDNQTFLGKEGQKIPAQPSATQKSPAATSQRQDTVPTATTTQAENTAQPDSTQTQNQHATQSSHVEGQNSRAKRDASLSDNSNSSPTLDSTETTTTSSRNVENHIIKKDFNVQRKKDEEEERDLFHMAEAAVNAVLRDVLPEKMNGTNQETHRLKLTEYLKSLGAIINKLEHIDVILNNLDRLLHQDGADKHSDIQKIHRKRRNTEELANQPQPLLTRLLTDQDDVPANTQSIENQPESQNFKEEINTDVAPTSKNDHLDIGMDHQKPAEVSDGILPNTQPIANKPELENLQENINTEVPSKNDQLNNDKDHERSAEVSQQLKKPSISLQPVPSNINDENEHIVMAPLPTQSSAEEEGEDEIVPEIGKPDADTNITIAPPTTTPTTEVPTEGAEIEKMLDEAAEVIVEKEILDREKMKMKSKMKTKKVISKFISREDSDSEEEPMTPRLATEHDIIRQIMDNLIKEQQKRAEMRRAKGKREAPPIYLLQKQQDTKEKPQSSVHSYHATPQEPVSEFLKKLRPGLYVVPSNDVADIHAEQISDEGPEKDNQPHVLTFKIFYQEKKEEKPEEHKKQQQWPSQFPPSPAASPLHQAQPTAATLEHKKLPQWPHFSPNQVQPFPTLPNRHHAEPVQAPPASANPFQFPTHHWPHRPSPVAAPTLPSHPVPAVHPALQKKLEMRYPRLPVQPNFLQPPVPYQFRQPEVSSPTEAEDQTNNEENAETPVSSFSTWQELSHPQSDDQETESDDGSAEEDSHQDEERYYLRRAMNEPNLYVKKELSLGGRKHKPFTFLEKRKFIEPYWNSTLREIFRETAQDPFWKILASETESPPAAEEQNEQQPPNASQEEANQDEEDNPQEETGKSRKKRSLTAVITKTSGKGLDTKPLDNAWNIVELPYHKAIDDQKRDRRSMLDNLLETERVAEQYPSLLDTDKVLHNVLSRKHLKKISGADSSLEDLTNKVTNYHFIAPKIVLSPAHSEPENSPSGSNTADKTNNADFLPAPMKQIYDVILEFIKNLYLSV